MSDSDERNELRRAQAVRNVGAAHVSVVFRLPGVTHDTSRITFDWFAWQDAEKVRQRRSRISQRLTVRHEYDSPLRSLRPCWTAFLRILRAILARDGPFVKRDV